VDRVEFEKWLAENYCDHESREKYHALEGYKMRQPEIDALRKENDHLRASLANSGGPCVYCNLPKEEWSKCASGFPGCSRADDAMLCPHVGLELEAQDEIKALKERLEGKDRVIATMRRVEEILRGDLEKMFEKNAALKAEVEKLRADAERYQWLRKNRGVLLLTGFFGNGCINRDIAEVDAAIDAAMKETKCQ
jgi:regulator of replication initiation timing